MIYLIMLIMGIIALITFIITNHIHIKFNTFIKKGFKKIDNAFGVHCFCGKQGTGKTYSSVDFCNRYIDDEYIVITNLKSYAKFLGEKAMYIKSINKIIEIANKAYKTENKINGKKYLIFFDEIFSEVEKSKTPKKVLSFLSQMRKRNIVFITTCQEWLELNITWRRYVRFQIDCNMWGFPFTKTAFLYNVIYDATKMKWSNLENEYIAPIVQSNLSKGLKSVIDSYDTWEVIGADDEE